MSLTFFVPGKLSNPLNGSWGFWYKHYRIGRKWRDDTAAAALATRGYWQVNLRMPKTITFTAHLGRLWDDDNLPAAVKPIRDEVVARFCLGDDGPKSGHKFQYTQVTDGRRGVTVHIEP